MDKTLFLHAGYPKTGSSSLQAFLTANRETLIAQRGIYYPRTGCLVDKWTDVHRHLFPVQEKLWDQLRKEVSQYPDSHVLLSDEWLMFRLPPETDEQDAFIEKIRSHFSGYRVRLIAYVRPIQAELPSFFAQYLKNYLARAPHLNSFPVDYRYFAIQFIQNKIDDCRADLFSGCLPFQLKGFIRLLGRENAIFRIYERTSLKHQNIIDDFFDAIGMEMPEPAVATPDVNPSLSRAQVAAQSWLFRQTPSQIVQAGYAKMLKTFFAFPAEEKVDQDSLREQCSTLEAVYERDIPGYADCCRKQPPVDVSRYDLSATEKGMLRMLAHALTANQIMMEDIKEGTKKIAVLEKKLQKLTDTLTSGADAG